MRRKLPIIVLILIVIFFIGLYINNSGTPDLTITSDDKKLQIVKPSFGWSTILKPVVKDNRTPLEVAKSLDAITVKPNTELILKFNREAKGLELSLWSEKSVRLLPSTNAIGVPGEKGVYVYRVVGQWKQGTAWYIFKVNVEGRNTD